MLSSINRRNIKCLTAISVPSRLIHLISHGLCIRKLTLSIPYFSISIRTWCIFAPVGLRGLISPHTQHQIIITWKIMIWYWVNNLRPPFQFIAGRPTKAIPRVASASEFIEPTQGFDSHESVIPPNPTDSLQNQFDRSQVSCNLQLLINIHKENSRI